MKFKFLLTSIFLLCITFLGSAQNKAQRITHFNLQNKLAIAGYDPVAYFLSSKAIKGSAANVVSQDGVTYYFSSAENKAAFLKTPAAYEPQYGGWCAYAMGDYGKKVEVDPETFKIVQGKLYLFYNAYLNNTLKTWNKDEARLKANADKNWKIILQN